MEYTYRHLIRAFLDVRRYKRAHEHLATYYGKRFTALCTVFNLSEAWPENWPGCERSHLDGLFMAAVSRHETVSSPFSGYMEAPEAICALSKKHGTIISDAASVFQDAVMELMNNTFLEVFGPAVGNAKFTSKDLLAVGFNDAAEAPDPDEYF